MLSFKKVKNDKKIFFIVNYVKKYFLRRNRFLNNECLIKESPCISYIIIYYI